MNKLQWIKLKRDFEAERCVLMIGPHLAKIKKADGSEGVLNEELSEHFADILDDSGISYEKEFRRSLPYISLRFLTIPGVRRVDLEDFTKEFYQENASTIPEVYKQLAKLPAKIIVNTNPDDFIQQALRAEGKQPIVLHYNYNRKLDQDIDIDKISKDTPIVYNLLGSLHDTESLIITKEDQLDFTRNVTKDDPPIPEEILGQFDHRKTYLFFGFNLENWQYLLLLDGLKIKEENTTLAPREELYPLSNVTKNFYQERFNFQFIDKDLGDFVNDLQQNILPQKNDQVTQTRKVFLLYHPKDEPFRIELENSLSQLAANKEITIQYPQKFTAGTDEAEIIADLQQSDWIFPLVSPNFLADDALSEKWLPLCAARGAEDQTQLRPIVIRPCNWRDNEHLRRCEPLPENQEPVTSQHWNTPDDAYFAIVQQIKKMGA